MNTSIPEMIEILDRHDLIKSKEAKELLKLVALEPMNLLEGVEFGHPYQDYTKTRWHLHVIQPHTWEENLLGKSAIYGTSKGNETWWAGYSSETMEGVINDAAKGLASIFAHRFAQWYIARNRGKYAGEVVSF